MAKGVRPGQIIMCGLSSGEVKMTHNKVTCEYAAGPPITRLELDTASTFLQFTDGQKSVRFDGTRCASDS